MKYIDISILILLIIVVLIGIGDMIDKIIIDRQNQMKFITQQQQRITELETKINETGIGIKVEGSR